MQKEMRLLKLVSNLYLWEFHCASELCNLEVRVEELPLSSQLGQTSAAEPGCVASLIIHLPGSCCLQPEGVCGILGNLCLTMNLVSANRHSQHQGLRCFCNTQKEFCRFLEMNRILLSSQLFQLLCCSVWKIMKSFLCTTMLWDNRS